MRASLKDSDRTYREDGSIQRERLRLQVRLDEIEEELRALDYSGSDSTKFLSLLREAQRIKAQMEKLL